MTITVPGVPEKITRSKYVALLEGAGLDPQLVSSVKFLPDGIYVEVATDSGNGVPFVDGEGGERHATRHRVYIPVVDDEPEGGS